MLASAVKMIEVLASFSNLTGDVLDLIEGLQAEHMLCGGSDVVEG